MADLAEEPLPEILRTIHHHRVSGVVTATSGDVVKKIYLMDGNVIFATSSDPHDLRQIVTEQVKAILYSVFSWENGTVTFEVERIRKDELIQLGVSTPQAIVDGIRQLPDPRRVVSRLGPSWTVFDRGEVPVEASGVSWSAGELKLLSRVDGRRTLRDLITAGPGDVSANAKLVYAFWMLHLVTRRDVKTNGIRKIQWKTGSGGLPGGGGVAAAG